MFEKLVVRAADTIGVHAKNKSRRDVSLRYIVLNFLFYLGFPRSALLRLAVLRLRSKCVRL